MNSLRLVNTVIAYRRLLLKVPFIFYNHLPESSQKAIGEYVKQNQDAVFDELRIPLSLP